MLVEKILNHFVKCCSKRFPQNTVKYIVSKEENNAVIIITDIDIYFNEINRNIINILTTNILDYNNINYTFFNL